MDLIKIKNTLKAENFLFSLHEPNLLSSVNYPGVDKIAEILSQLPLMKLSVCNWDEISLQFQRALTDLELNLICENLSPSNIHELKTSFSKLDKFNLNWIKS